MTRMSILLLILLLNGCTVTCSVYAEYQPPNEDAKVQAKMQCEKVFGEICKR